MRCSSPNVLAPRVSPAWIVLSGCAAMIAIEHPDSPRDNPGAPLPARHPTPYRQPYFGTAVILGIDRDAGDTLSMLGAAQLTAVQLTQLHSVLQHA
jgi:hypothetical protein